MSERITELVLMAKEFMQEGDKESESSLREIENSIDDKSFEIKEIFKRNIDQILDHYTKYHEIIYAQKRLENHCEEFSKRIEKVENLNMYDESMIERSQKNLQALRAKKNEVESYRDAISKLKKAAICIEEERYNNAIKLINSYKEMEPQQDTPLKKALPIFREKIKVHLIKLVDSFWTVNHQKIVDIGTLCYNKVELSTHEKINIYQAFFGRNSARNSLIRASCIADERTEAPLRFFKKVKDEEILQKYVLRLNIDMNCLKQMNILCKEMGEEGMFEELVNKHIRKLIQEFSDEAPCDSETDLKKLLSFYIGFLLYRREVVAHFKIEDDAKLVLRHVYSLVAKHSKSLIMKPDDLGQILKVKSLLDIFHKVLQIVYLDRNASQFSEVLAEIFKIFCSYSLDQYEQVFGDQINSDNLLLYIAEDPEEQKLIEEVFRIKPDHHGSYNFTKFVFYSLQVFNQFFDRIVSFVRDSELNKAELHAHLSTLLERIIAIYGGNLVANEFPMQIAQGEINLIYCEKIWKYFSEQLESKYEYIRLSEPLYRLRLEAIIVEMRRQMREVVEEKIFEIMCSYESPQNWMPNQINNAPNDFVEWMLEYLKDIILNLRKIEHPAHEEMAYSWLGYISQIYWENLENCQAFSLITIHNLELDLMLIYKFVHKNFAFYPNASDKFRSLTEFYSLLLTNNLLDFCEKAIRDISYSHLDLNQVLAILSKYKKAKTNCNAKIRELKEKDVQYVIRRVEKQISNK